LFSRTKKEKPILTREYVVGGASLFSWFRPLTCNKSSEKNGGKRLKYKLFEPKNGIILVDEFCYK
ncbi:MAG: hypothetical protein ACRCTN_10110, partial [Carnobacterium maltaromaticum]